MRFPRAKCADTLFTGTLLTPHRNTFLFLSNIYVIVQNVYVKHRYIILFKLSKLSLELIVSRTDPQLFLNIFTRVQLKLLIFVALQFYTKYY